METENCPRCGRPLGDKALIATCGECLNERYRVELFLREAEHLAALKEPKIVVASQGLRNHLVLAIDHGRTYCGTGLTAPHHKRIKHALTSLPDGLCKDCANKLAEVLASAKALTGKGFWS